MLRIGLFFEGRNFHAGWKDSTDCQKIDFVRLARWVSQYVANGDATYNANYYSTIESESRDVDRFLTFLSTKEGFTVNRFAYDRGEGHESSEKRLRAQLVADMVLGAAQNKYDIAVLFSGDSANVPGISAVRELGHNIFIANWGSEGVSSEVRREAYAAVDLLNGLSKFLLDENATEDIGRFSQEDLSEVTDEEMSVFCDALEDAENKFKPNGFVGLHYFLNRWQAPGLTSDINRRGKIFEACQKVEMIEVYETEEGSSKAIRNIYEEDDV